MVAETGMEMIELHAANDVKLVNSGNRNQLSLKTSMNGTVYVCLVLDTGGRSVVVVVARSLF